MPRSVSLRFRTMAGSPLVEARDGNGELLFADSLRGTAEWLDVAGYRYVVGSNGVWAAGQ